MVGICIDRESHLLPRLHLSDIGLVEFAVNLHFMKIIGYVEQRLCLQTDLHGLPRIDVALDDHTFNRGADLGACKILLGLFERGLFFFKILIGKTSQVMGQITFGRGLCLRSM